MIRTELEHCVLGVIWQRGPCSAYAVRAEFAKSLSAHWSASAGSIYPVVERLVDAGLVRARARSNGRRASRELTISKRGLSSLRRWIERIDRTATSATYDSVRTRFLFFKALPLEEDRNAAFAKAVEETKASLAELEALDERDEPMEALATLGAQYELKARLAWLGAIEMHLLA
jgi:DNA-binding PadR family transcriptional regulator